MKKLNSKQLTVLNRKNWDWLVFLKRAKRAFTTKRENHLAGILAANWDTCACSELHSDLKPSNDNREDNQLFDLGLDQHWFKARLLLTKIHQREQQLIKKHGLKKKK